MGEDNDADADDDFVVVEVWSGLRDVVLVEGMAGAIVVVVAVVVLFVVRCLWFLASLQLHGNR